VRLLLDPKRQRFAVQLAPRCVHRLACRLHLICAGRWLPGLEGLQIRLQVTGLDLSLVKHRCPECHRPQEASMLKLELYLPMAGRK